MATRTRVGLALLGLLLILGSLSLIWFALGPGNLMEDRVVPPPTLFVPPQSRLVARL